MMKHAFVDITLEALTDLLRLPNSTLRKVEASPLGENYIRLILEGDLLPDVFSDKPRAAKLYYDGWLASLILSIEPADRDR